MAISGAAIPEGVAGEFSRPNWQRRVLAHFRIRAQRWVDVARCSGMRCIFNSGRLRPIRRVKYR